MVKIDFGFDSIYGRYNDSIVLPDDHTLTPEDIEQIKQDRFNVWWSAVDVQSNTVPVEDVQVSETPPAQGA